MQVSMHEFKSHLSRYVSQAQSGQLIELTSRRKVVARIIGAIYLLSVLSYPVQFADQINRLAGRPLQPEQIFPSTDSLKNSQSARYPDLFLVHG